MSKRLNLQPHLSRPDDFYAALMQAHQSLTLEQSQRLNAKLILLLANHIGQHDVLLQALEAALANTLEDNQ